MVDKRRVFALIAGEYTKRTYENGYPTGLKRMIRVSSLLLRRPIAVAQTIMGGYLPVKYFEIVVTSACTLKCRDCANLIQFYNGETENSRPCHYSCDEVIWTLKKVLMAVDEIAVLGILGGEPFVYPELDELLLFCINQRKIKNIRVTTNGTIAKLDSKTIEMLKNKKVHVLFSNYGDLSRNMAKAINIFKENGIEYYVKPEDSIWFENGNVSKRGRSEKQLADQFKNCGEGCPSLLKGEMHYCARSSHGKDLGIIPVKDDEFIDIKKYSSVTSLRNAIEHFFYGRRKFVTACDFCDMAIENAKAVTPAIQIGRKDR